MNFLNLRRASWCIALLLLMTSCRQKKTELKSPKGYNFQTVGTTKLEPELKEISGLVWDPVKNVFIAHIDEGGTLYYLNRDTKKIVDKFPFADKGDYEDIALVDETPYVLKSNGSIYKVVPDSGTKNLKGIDLGKIALEGTSDFETMYYDSSRHALIMICKNCDVDDKKTVSAFAYYLDSTGFDTKPVFQIDAEQIKQLSPKETSKFQPSAARIQPNLKKLFIISSASNLLAITDLNGKVESVHWLKPKMFPQPEGLTFNKTGDMYISNEGGTGMGTILLFVAKDSARRQP